MAPRRAVFAASLSILVVFAGCSRRADSSRAPADAWGRAVALPAKVERIVSLSPATTELVFALGLGEKLVGRTTWCDYPPAALAVPDLGNGIGINVEAVARQRPDLVLVYPSEANRAAVAQLEALRIPVAALAQDGIEQWRTTARWVARAAGVSERADSLLADFDRRLALTRVSAGDQPRVFIAVGANPPIVIGAGSFLSELLALSGGRNAFADIAAPSATVSLEAIVARDPDIVLILGPDSAIGGVQARAGWRAIPAVKSGRVIAISGSQFDRPSPRLPEAVAQLGGRFAAMGVRPGTEGRP